MTVEKPMRKCLLRPITTPEKSAMNQLEILAIACNLLKVEENPRGQYNFYWLEKTVARLLSNLLSVSIVIA